MFSRKSGHLVSFNKTARTQYLQFGHSVDALWSANFRDLNASITRMATLADGGRITTQVVAEEIERLRHKWQPYNTHENDAIINTVLSIEECATLDHYEKTALAEVLRVCQTSKTMAEAGRILFNVSRTLKKSNNDSHRVKQLLEKYHIRFEDIPR